MCMNTCACAVTNPVLSKEAGPSPAFDLESGFF